MDVLCEQFGTPELMHTRIGFPVNLRRVDLADGPLLVELLHRLSTRTRQLRYFTPRAFTLETAWAEAERMVRGHAGTQLTIIASSPQTNYEQVIGVAELVPVAGEPTAASVAMVVRDDHQGRGIGRALAEQLSHCARATGISRLHADLLAENRAMRRLLEVLGTSYTTVTRYGETAATIEVEAGGGTSDSPPVPVSRDRSFGMSAWESEDGSHADDPDTCMIR
jgi:RimJ/RimL family protein N-acetyltransferase